MVLIELLMGNQKKNRYYNPHYHKRKIHSVMYHLIWKEKNNTKFNTNGCNIFLVHSHPLLPSYSIFIFNNLIQTYLFLLREGCQLKIMTNINSLE